MHCIETQGIEWDWFARDDDGHVALVSSGGSGQVPPVLLAHDAAIESFMQFLGLRCDAGMWASAARRGLFAYDVDANGGPFKRLFSPDNPVKWSDLPAPLRSLVGLVVVRGCFFDLPSVDCSLVSF